MLVCRILLKHMNNLNMIWTNIIHIGSQVVPGITHIFVKRNGTVFEEFIRNARTDRYNLICSIDSHQKQQPSYIDDVSNGGGNVSPSNSITEALVSLCATIDFIYFWR